MEYLDEKAANIRIRELETQLYRAREMLLAIECGKTFNPGDWHDRLDAMGKILFNQTRRA